MKHSLALLITAVSVIFPVLLQGDASVYPLGVTIYIHEKCWNGFTILSILMRSPGGYEREFGSSLERVAPSPEQSVCRRIPADFDRRVEIWPAGRHPDSIAGFQR